MPFTFLSHQAPVVPLKMLWPRWFDGTALVVGSMAPDLLYVTYGSPVYVYAHTPWTQVWLAAPVTILLTWMVKRVIAGPLAAHLPDLGAWHLRDFGRLAAWRMPTTPRRWLVLVASALIGSLSHLLLDSFTHSFGWTVEHVAALRAQVMVPARAGARSMPVYDLLQLGGSAVGALLVAWCLLMIGRRRSLLSWYPNAPARRRPTRASRVVLSASVGAGGAAGIVVGAMTGFTPGAPASIIRASACTFLGLLIGCLSAGPLMLPHVSTDVRATDEGARPLVQGRVARP